MKVPHFHRAEVVAVMILLTAVWGYEESLGPLESFVFDQRYGAVPVRLWGAWHELRSTGLSRDVLVTALPLLTASFLHAGFAHLAGNLLFLWIFGNALSEAAGRVAFLVLYVLAGVTAVLVHVRTNPGSEIPMVGASGAIAGLEGAYFALAYRWELPHAHVWPLDGPIPPWRFGGPGPGQFLPGYAGFLRPQGGRDGLRRARGRLPGRGPHGHGAGLVLAAALAPRMRSKRTDYRTLVRH